MKRYCFTIIVVIALLQSGCSTPTIPPAQVISATSNISEVAITETVIPPTNTPIPPTATPIPTSTSTVTPTHIPLPPTFTPFAGTHDLSTIEEIGAIQLEEDLNRQNMIRSMALTADGQYLAYYSGLLGVIRIIRTIDQKTFFDVKTGMDFLLDFTISHDGEWMAVFSYNRANKQSAKIQLWNLAERKKKGEFKVEDPGSADNRFLDFSPDSKMLIGATDNDVIFWDVNTLKLQHKHRNLVDYYGFTPQGDLYCGTLKNNPLVLRFFDTKTGEEKQNIPLESHIGAVAFAPDGNRFAVSDTDGKVHVLTLDQSEKLPEINAYSFGYAYSLRFDPMGEKLLAKGGNVDVEFTPIGGGKFNKKINISGKPTTEFWNILSARAADQFEMEHVISDVSYTEFSADWSILVTLMLNSDFTAQLRIWKIQ